MSDSSPAQPEPIKPNSLEESQPKHIDAQAPQEIGKSTERPEHDSGVDGVKVGGLKYTLNEDGTRTYEGQEPVDTE